VANQAKPVLVTGQEDLDGHVTVLAPPRPAEPEDTPHLLRRGVDLDRERVILHGTTCP
jgi:hypothetical protein